jgi:hypothetical protein
MDWDFGKPSAACCRCGRPLGPGEQLVSALTEGGPGGPDHVRQDFCPACWEAGPRPDPVVAQWRTTVPRRETVRKARVADDVLLGLFEGIDGTEDPAQIRFRFVLALMLMRRRVLHYEGSQVVDGREWWTLRRASPGRKAKASDAEADGNADAPSETPPTEPPAESSDGPAASGSAGNAGPVMRVLNPRLTEEEIAAVSEQVGRTLESQPGQP